MQDNLRLDLNYWLQIEQFPFLFIAFKWYNLELRYVNQRRRVYLHTVSASIIAA